MSRTWECIAVTEAVLLRVAFPTLAAALLLWMALTRDGIALEALPTAIGLLCGRLAPPLRTGDGGDARRTDGSSPP